jgi:hypothetical protein
LRGGALDGLVGRLKRKISLLEKMSKHDGAGNRQCVMGS